MQRDFLKWEKCCYFLINGVIRDNPIMYYANCINRASELKSKGAECASARITHHAPLHRCVRHVNPPMELSTYGCTLADYSP